MLELWAPGDPGCVFNLSFIWYWGSFLYKKREFSIQDIIIYHHISCQYHFVSCCIIISIISIMSLVDT